MPTSPLAPLRFTPLFKTAVWGGTRLRPMFGAPPSSASTGEAWVLSDQGDNQSVVADGPWAGTTMRQLMTQLGNRLLGRSVAAERFPLLLKFIHAREPLSVQVHPTDAKARELEGPSFVGKTEAWFVLEADPTARIYAGLQPGVTASQLQQGIESGDVEDLLHVHAPEAGDCLFLPAGTVHAIGGGLVLFEIQQTSDITYRLFDWGRGRELHIEKGLKCVNYQAGPCRPVYPTDEGHGRVRLAPLIECEHFMLGRWDTKRPFRAGAADECRVLVGISGRAILKHGGNEYTIGVGDVLLLPAEVGACECVPQGEAMILECGLGN